MRVADAMTRNVQLVTPDQTIVDAARMMADNDIGSLPVTENDRLVGMITDRDIVVRAIAQGKPVDCQAREAMSQDIKYVFEDEDLDDVAHNMADLQIRRMPVVDKNKRLVGIVSLGDIATSDKSPAAEALSGISAPGSSRQVGGQLSH